MLGLRKEICEGHLEGDVHTILGPFEHLEVDFTEIKPHRHYHYLLVMVCTFLGWVEAFPTRLKEHQK